MKGSVQLLKDPAVAPDDRTLPGALGDKVFGVYNGIVEKIAALGLDHEWRYYNDGKAWLSKAVYKKKTVFWLSAWEGFIKTSFFFTDKTAAGVSELDIDDALKDTFAATAVQGKLKALVMDIYDMSQLDDLEKVVRYKMSLK